MKMKIKMKMQIKISNFKFKSVISFVDFLNKVFSFRSCFVLFVIIFYLLSCYFVLLDNRK